MSWDIFARHLILRCPAAGRVLGPDALCVRILWVPSSYLYDLFLANDEVARDTLPGLAPIPAQTALSLYQKRLPSEHVGGAADGILIA